MAVSSTSAHTKPFYSTYTKNAVCLGEPLGDYTLQPYTWVEYTNHGQEVTVHGTVYWKVQQFKGGTITIKQDGITVDGCR